MSGLGVVAQIVGWPTFLAGEVLCCEVRLSSLSVQGKCANVTLSGIAVGQYRLNPLAINNSLIYSAHSTKVQPDKHVTPDVPLSLTNNIFSDGLDPHSRISWSCPMRSKCSNSLVLTTEKPMIKVSFKCRLPENLPPSYRGNIIRVAYKLMISAQLEGRSPHLLHLPFRVLPSVSAYTFSEYAISASSSTITGGMARYSDGECSLNQIDDKNPFRYETGLKEDGKERQPKMHDLLGNGCLSREELHPAIYDKLSQLYSDVHFTSNASHPRRRKKKKTKQPKINSETYVRKKSLSRSPSAMFAEIISSSSFATFVISGPNGQICRLGMLKTAVRLGDSLRGFLDFRSATQTCFECTIRSQTSECAYPIPENAPPESSGLHFFTSPTEVVSRNQRKVPPIPENSMRNSWSAVELSCSNVKFLPFVIPIPLNAPPEFLLKGKDLNISFHVRWCLRFEFVVAKSKRRLTSSNSSSSDSGFFTNFLQDSPSKTCADFTPVISVGSQTFSWELPINILPNGSADFIFPSESRNHVLLSVP